MKTEMQILLLREGITQQQIADKLKVNKALVSRVITGKQKHPRIQAYLHRLELKLKKKNREK